MKKFNLEMKIVLVMYSAHLHPWASVPEGAPFREQANRPEKRQPHQEK